MLALDDPRWHNLRTGYSPAAKFLPLLRRMADDPHEAPAVSREFAAANHVCHQGDVYETTVAVVPHFIHAASLLPPGERGSILACVGFEVLQLGSPLAPTPGMMTIDPPADVVAAYNAAMPRAAALAAEALSVEASEVDTLWLMLALAAFRGQRRIAGLLFRVRDWVACPLCGGEFEPLGEWGKPF